MPTTYNVTNGQLYDDHKTISSRCDDPFYKLIFSRVDAWYKVNGLRIETITETLQKLAKEYHEVEEDGQIKMGEPDEQGNKLPVLKEGKTKEEYEAAFNAYMSEPNVVTWP